MVGAGVGAAVGHTAAGCLRGCQTLCDQATDNSAEYIARTPGGQADVAIGTKAQVLGSLNKCAGPLEYHHTTVFFL